MPPYGATWSDAIGGAQVCYTPDDGWMGSIVQLQLGDYGPLRFHLRLFQCDSPFGVGGRWTVGAAHFEMLIPGTTDHVVLSWELAEQVVVDDLTRAGLLDQTTPTETTGSINEAPSFRTIPAMLYNGIPDPIKVLIGTPPGPSATDVPISSDGEGTVLHLSSAPTVMPGVKVTSQTVDFQQVIPRPFCASGSFDLLLVQGPVDFRKVVEVDGSGHLTFRERFEGVLQAIPVDVSSGSPVPIGEAFVARVLGHQSGFAWERLSNLQSFDRRITFDGRRAEWVKTQLLVSPNGKATFRSGTHCVE